MAQHNNNNNFMLDDDPEINLNSPNLAAALVVIGQTARNFITRMSTVFPGPTVPEHRANLENRNKNSLTYKPYRPYTSFTPVVPREGQHSSHSLHRVLQSTPTSSLLNVASLQATTTESPSSFSASASSTSPDSPSISMTVSPVIPTMRPDASTLIPITALPYTSTASTHLSSPTTAPMSILDTQQTDKNDTIMDDRPPSQADREILMDHDIPTTAPPPPTNHVTSPKPISGLPLSSGRMRALPLPSVTESHLGRLVNQQLSQISDKVVVPALKSAVDTMIPTLIDWIASEIKIMHSTYSHNPRVHNSCAQKHGGTSEEDDTSKPECDDDLMPSARRKHPGKQGTKNNLHTGCYPLVIFDEDRMSLDDLHVLCIIKLRQTQQAYRDQSKIAGFTDVQQRKEATCELSSCSTWRQRLDRLNTCKHGTLERCQKIAEQNCHRDPQMWDAIRCIIDQLDVNGMSRDETDTPVGVKPKVVRHVALLWISSAITDLLHAVESYAPAMYEENMTIPIGNTSLSCFMEARCTSKNSIAITWLPRNWYHDDWYKANSTSAQALLDICKDFEIPHLPNAERKAGTLYAKATMMCWTTFMVSLPVKSFGLSDEELDDLRCELDSDPLNVIVSNSTLGSFINCSKKYEVPFLNEMLEFSKTLNANGAEGG
ncbi:uncharacterized protein EDB93DRAFT_1103005 [Suillus bovinus]|uniref:uncharacterized protein n=1 Tax=Suillus bovinus TaxID=48563 RepID=UPI001B8676F8|nr:uncharacterized protein EDB93DRAFT_1103005 [Suillus bovinus]KAG2151552.1 hypothetical protein EDB93DRAFT_1103005 [Suillus bovinus]